MRKGLERKSAWKNFFSFISIAHHLSTNMTGMCVIVCTKLDGWERRVDGQTLVNDQIFSGPGRIQSGPGPFQPLVGHIAGHRPDGKGDCAIRLCSLTRSFLASSTQHMCSTSSQLASVWASWSECYSAVHCNIMQYYITTLTRSFSHVSSHHQLASLCLVVLWNHNEIHALFLSDPLKYSDVVRIN